VKTGVPPFPDGTPGLVPLSGPAPQLTLARTLPPLRDGLFKVFYPVPAPATARSTRKYPVTVPVVAVRDAASGCGFPVGHAVKYPSVPFGTAAKFSE
jgi:hypothetical protein